MGGAIQLKIEGYADDEHDMHDPHPSASDNWHQVSGWRRVVAKALAYWYLTALAAGVLAFLLVWVWFFSGGPAQAYWACMDSQIPVYRDLGWQPQQVFSSADSYCAPRPSGLSTDQAHAEWFRRWEAAASSVTASPRP